MSGLASLSDTLATSRLTPNALVIDGNLTAGAGIDLGAPTPLEDPQSRNIGLDFLNPVEVNRLLVWVDRDLPIEVANSFSWELYSSQDNVVWRRETVVSAAPFGPFEFRFEVEFPRVSARYVKVVVRPLSVAVPEASRFPDILVTEMHAFLRMPAEEASSRLTETTHLVNTDVLAVLAALFIANARVLAHLKAEILYLDKKQQLKFQVQPGPGAQEIPPPREPDPTQRPDPAPDRR